MDRAAKRKYESPRQLARQASILAATREMLAEVGYNGMTMRSLAERAGVVPGTLYNLYKSKDELILAALEDLLDEIGARMVRSSEPGIDRVLCYYRLLAQSLQRNPAYAEAMGRALFRSEPDHPLQKLLYGRAAAVVEVELAVAQTSGAVRPEADVQLTAKHCAATGWGVIMAWVMGVFTLEEVCSEYLRAHYLVLLPIVNEELRAEFLRAVELAHIPV